MSSPVRKALVLGGTGLVGRALVDLLVRTPAWSEVRTLVRRPEPALAPHHRPVVVDYDQLSALAALLAVDDVFCCLGTTLATAGSAEAFRRVDLEYPLAAARLAVAHQASQFLMVSAVGASPSSLFFYSRTKGEAEAAIQALPFRSVHLFRPSLLLGTRAENRPWEALGQRLAPFLHPALIGPLRAYRAIAAPAVAQAMVQAALARTPGVHIYEYDEMRTLDTQGRSI